MYSADDRFLIQQARPKGRPKGILTGHTAADHNFRRDRRLMMTRLKSEPCMDCRTRFLPEAMEFDHRPGEAKVAAISAMAFGPIDALLAEIAKCDLVCANCHRVRTHGRRTA